MVDDSFLLVFNAHHDDVEVTLPGEGDPQRWARVLDTTTGDVVVGTVRGTMDSALDDLSGDRPAHVGGDVLTLTARSMLLLQRTDVPA